MKSEVLKKSEAHKVFNDIVLKNEIVIFGSTYMAEFPFYELEHKYLLSNAIYNRSITSLTTEEALEILDFSVFGARPAKIFYALGECDISYDDSFISTYEDILKKTKKVLPQSKIYVLSVPSDDEKTNVNHRLSALCKSLDAEFIPINYKSSYSSLFRRLSPFFRSKALTFLEAFKMAE